MVLPLIWLPILNSCNSYGGGNSASGSGTSYRTTRSSSHQDMKEIMKETMKETMEDVMKDALGSRYLSLVSTTPMIMLEPNPTEMLNHPLHSKE